MSKTPFLDRLIPSHRTLTGPLADERAVCPHIERHARVVNSELLDQARTWPVCLQCGKPPTKANPMDPHHVKHVGAGGGDVAGNVVPLHRFCHSDCHNGRISLRRQKELALTWKQQIEGAGK